MQERAGLNQVFICMSCSKLFLDRAVQEPVGLDLTDVVVQEQVVTPHEKYPNDPDLAILVNHDVVADAISIPAEPATPCCASHAVLCRSSRLRFRREPDGRVHVIGAEHLE